MAESISAFIIITIISLFIIWAIISIPVWLSAKILTSGRSSFGRAMLVSAIGLIVYSLVLIISANLSSLTIGNRSLIIMSIGLVLAFLAWIYVYERGFQTGWIRGIRIALLAIVLFIVTGVAIAFYTSICTHLAANHNNAAFSISISTDKPTNNLSHHTM